MNFLSIMIFVVPIVTFFSLLVVSLLKRVDKLEARLVEAERKRKMVSIVRDRFQEYKFRRDFQLRNLDLNPFVARLMEDDKYYKQFRDFRLSVERDLQLQVPKSEVYEAISEAFPNTTEATRRRELMEKPKSRSRKYITPGNPLFNALLIAARKRK